MQTVPVSVLLRDHLLREGLRVREVVVDEVDKDEQQTQP